MIENTELIEIDILSHTSAIDVLVSASFEEHGVWQVCNSKRAVHIAAGAFM